MKLTEQQTKRIVYALHEGVKTKRPFDIEKQIDYLEADGIPRDTGKLLVIEAAYKERDRLVKKEEDDEGKTKLVLMAIFLFGGLGGFMNITSPAYYIITSLIVAGIGYWAYDDKPIAGAVGSFIAVAIAPFAVSIYISGRSSILNLELFIPLGISIACGALVGWLLSMAIYSDKS